MKKHVSPLIARQARETRDALRAINRTPGDAFILMALEQIAASEDPPEKALDDLLEGVRTVVLRRVRK